MVCVCVWPSTVFVVSECVCVSTLAALSIANIIGTVSAYINGGGGDGGRKKRKRKKTWNVKPTHTEMANIETFPTFGSVRMPPGTFDCRSVHARVFWHSRTFGTCQCLQFEGGKRQSLLPPPPLPRDRQKHKNIKTKKIYDSFVMLRLKVTLNWH